MRFNLFKRNEITEVEKRAKTRQPMLRLKKSISKAMGGAMYDLKEYDIQGDRQPSPSEPLRLGNEYLPPASKTGVLPFVMREFNTSTGTPEPDPFLRGDAKDGYIGGRTKPYRAGLEFMRDVAGGYQFRQPDADERDPANPFADPEGGSGMRDASSQNWPNAGQVGSREPSSFTQKMAVLRAMYDEETDDEKRKALRAAAKAMYDEEREKRMVDDDDESKAMYDEEDRKSTRKSRGSIFKSAIFGRQSRGNSNPGVAAADDFLSGGR